MSDKRPVGTHLGPELYDYVAGVTARRNISASKYLHELVLNDMDPLSADKEINAVTLTNILDRLGIQDQKIDFFFALFVHWTAFYFSHTQAIPEELKAVRGAEGQERKEKMLENFLTQYKNNNTSDFSRIFSSIMEGLEK